MNKIDVRPSTAKFARDLIAAIEEEIIESVRDHIADMTTLKELAEIADHVNRLIDEE